MPSSSPAGKGDRTVQTEKPSGDRPCTACTRRPGGCNRGVLRRSAPREFFQARISSGMKAVRRSTGNFHQATSQKFHTVRFRGEECTDRKINPPNQARPKKANCPFFSRSRSGGTEKNCRAVFLWDRKFHFGRSWVLPPSSGFWRIGSLGFFMNRHPQWTMSSSLGVPQKKPSRDRQVRTLAKFFSACVAVCYFFFVH